MLKMYFSNLTSMLSTLLIIGFVIFFGIVFSKRGNITHWGILVLCIFFMGLLMSFMSGMRDKVSTAASVIPLNGWAMLTLSVLGGLAFVAGIVMIIIRKQNIWQLGFYTLSTIIMLKIVVTEAYRIAKHFI